MSRRNSQDIPTKKVSPPRRLVVMNPSKGENNLVSPSLIDNREWAELMNIEYDEGGVLRKRSGYVAVGDALSAAKGLGVYATESTRYLVTIDGTTLKYRTTGNWSSATGATFTAGNECSFTQARLKLFCWNGTDGGAYFTGTAVTRPGTMPKAKFSVYYQNYHIASGVAGQPSRLYVSNASDATDFTVTTGGTQPQPDNTNDAENGNPNVPGATVFSGTPSTAEARVFDVRKNDGDKITGLAVFQDVLIIFKERSIYQMTFDSTGLGTITPITYSTGCVSHKSIKNVENDVYFLSREGTRVLGNEPQFFTAIRTSVLSVRVQNTIDSINKKYYDYSNAVYFDSKYILAVPTTTSSSITKCIMYDRRFQAFTKWQNFNAQDMIKFIDSNNEEGLYFLDTDGTQVYMRQEGTYSDDGVAIEAWATSKAQEIGNPDLMKFWVDVRLVLRRLSGQISITLYKDDDLSLGTAVLGSLSLRGMGLVMLGTTTLGLDGQTSTVADSFSDTPISISLNTDSRTIKYKIYNNEVNQNFVLLGTIYSYYPKSHFVFDSSKKVYL